MLGSNVRVLEDLGTKGLVEVLEGVPLDQKIATIFSHYDRYKKNAMDNRSTFLKEFSYGANRRRINTLIGDAMKNAKPVSAEMQALVACHREVFDTGERCRPRVTSISVCTKPGFRRQQVHGSGECENGPN